MVPPAAADIPQPLPQVPGSELALCISMPSVQVKETGFEDAGGWRAQGKDRSGKEFPETRQGGVC